MFKKYTALVWVLITLCAHAKVVVWDLGFTLVDTNKFGIVGEIGWGTSISAFFNGAGSQKYLRNTMNAILLQGSGCQQMNDPASWVRDENGTVLPLIMADHWLTNKLTSDQILALTDQYIDAWNAQKKFRNKAEKNMLKGVMRTVFSPTIVAKHTSVIGSALNLVKKCSLRGSAQYILSNWERESFEALYANKKNMKLFKYIPRSKITVSGDCGLVKPHASIFTYFIEKYNLNPAECIFIDDQEENVLAARACGLCALHLQNGDYKKLEKELKELHAL